MNNVSLDILVVFVSGLFFGGLIFLFYLKLTKKKRDQNLKQEKDMILNRAKSKASKIERVSKEKAREWEEKELKRIQKEQRAIEENLKNKEYKLKKRQDQIDMELQARKEELQKRETDLKQEKESLAVIQKQLENLKARVQKDQKEAESSLERLAVMTKEEAREHLQKMFEEEVKQEISGKLLSIEEEMKKTQNEKAKLILAQAVARYSAEVTAERTVETLPIVGSSTKGKIIGREGRNIRALEASCGVDLIIGEGQEIVTISCFDPVRRVIAKRTLEKLMEEGRVHPAFIEEVVDKTRKEVSSEIIEEGKKVCFDMGIHDTNPEIVKVLGRLKYRFIEGQNLLKYSIEVAYIASLLAGELSYDRKKANRAGLLHAIGMGVPHFIEGSYSFVGSQFCKKQGEEEEICQAILCHDGKQPARSILDHILQCAYNLSRSRSGAKRSLLESYINRLKDLESLANSFDGVKRSYAVQAGKEIRVLVDTFKVTDEGQMSMLSWDIAKKIQREMKLSEEVKVSVIREYRIVEHAR